MRYLAAILVLLVGLTGPFGSARSDGIEVDAELFLAVDVSRSMTANELEIQRRGYAEALASPAVVKAIESGFLGRIAITYVEWAGTYSQRVIVDWSIIKDQASATAFANRLTAEFNESLRRTSISGALDFAVRSIETNKYTANRRIIDVSGDGPNNQGRPVLDARAEVLSRGVIINGLPLMTREGLGSTWHLEDLDEYYRHCVIGGPGSFVIPVLKWSHFPEAVRRKLILELAGGIGQSDDHSLLVPVKTSGYDCLIGEKMWREFRRNWLP